MRHISPITVALLAAIASFNVSAASVGSPSCPLLVREDLSGLGVDKDTSFIDSDWNWGETPKETPDAKVISNMCMVNLKNPGGKIAVMLSVDSFQGKVTVEQVSQWLKATDNAETDEPGVSKVKIGETECETGVYELPTSGNDGDVENINELYVACDAQVGTRHISLNVHVPEAIKASLPSPEQTKAMLDKSVQRLKDAAVGQKT
jgi:hypothetical protein